MMQTKELELLNILEFLQLWYIYPGELVTHIQKYYDRPECYHTFTTASDIRNDIINSILSE